jgi:hypothetical protein
MSTDRQMSNVVFKLLCVQAEAGRPIDLARAGLRPTFEQAKTLVTLMNRAAILSLRKDSFDDYELVELRLLGCKWVDGKLSDRPETVPSDDQATW